MESAASVPVAPPDTEAWHALPAEAALQRLTASPDGLSAEEAARRLRAHGPNALPAPEPTPWWRRLLRHFNDPLILFLLAAAILAALLRHYVDAGVIAAVVLVNAIVGYVQEGRAEQALAGLRSMLAPSARVLREGERAQVPAGDLVPGDVVVLEAGDRVPADARLLRGRGLRVDESVLTGESVPVEKSAEPVADDADLGGRTSMLYSGTLVAAGQASVLVVATGRDTQVGRIGRLLGEVQTLTTPLLEQTARFGKAFTLLALVAAALLFVFAVTMRGYGWLDALMVVVALAVGVVPESLPAVITITLAIGVRRMAARNAIVRRLPAVETLGATTTICSDKTGTLTRNEMTARSVVTATGRVEAEGSGYAPAGALAVHEGGDVALAAAQGLAQIGLLCNDAHLHGADDAWRIDGDPMEGALLALAGKAGFDPAALRSAHPRLDEVPFDAAHRFMATLHADGEGGGALVCVKGAPEQILALSVAQAGRDGERVPVDVAFWQNAIDAAGAEGQRVLGFAARRLGRVPERFGLEDVGELVFCGIVGFIDPPRDEAIEAVARCRDAGIAVKMITGDHAATAAAIAMQLRLADEVRMVTGRELDDVAEADLPALAEAASVFARTTPEHKLRIVRALQSRGHTVAMTGDGVNDAPSLKQADIGIAMGHNGTEAAKEASEMVLADDNFASIAAAVYEGRAVYDNIRKVIAWTLPTNGGEALAIALALIAGWTLPMTAPQILWINMVLTITLGLSLAFEPPESGVMQRPPRRRVAPLVSPFMLWRIVLVSILFSFGAFGIFAWAQARGHDIATARTMVVNMFYVMEIFYLFSVRYMHASSFSLRGLRGTPAVLWAVTAVVVAQLAFTYLPVMHTLFDSRPVPLFEGVVIVLAAAVLMPVLEIEKWVLGKLDLFAELRRSVPAPRRRSTT
ncbi:HAD-IC family P-type ATPase [Xanthomonas hortorum]|uniref:HAD-IC family P-type ATPase n=1 Tax=Xanthomonas hortorum TaxID=56454 RepID=UPI000CEEDED7|nr:HAD-IC family P-type ATPase [Xanthomonas hortorum]MCE4369644.1 HAD-IC family P-type ATPase [Xanthomonas hortorum pv. hederae]PPU86187.1 carbonate dehydratase [Xanthomonas hortorum pv. hederae]PUF01251.1 carbonate dehydratase [Xanthomonas hortorum pv. hederae]